MNHLLRELAPISPTGWREIEKEATRTLKTTLAARRLVDFVGPQGWSASSVCTGRVEAIDAPAGGIEARLRRVLPLVELRVPFELSRSELEAISRGAKDPDLDAVIAAARTIATAEDHAIFHGYAVAGIEGICQAQAKLAVDMPATHEDYPVAIATAMNRLRDAGVDGPFAVALSEQGYAHLMEITKAGYPALQHVRRLIDGPIVWAPGLDGAVVLSMRGEDFELTVGQDFSIGYRDHDAERVRLYIEESFTFQILSAQAAIPMVYRSGKKR